MNLNTICHIDTIKGKVVENKIIFTKTEKGNTVIAIPELDYANNKVNEFLNSNSFAKVKTNLTYKFQKQITEAINTSDALFKHKSKHTFNLMNSQSVKLFGLIKLHKTNTQITTS